MLMVVIFLTGISWVAGDSDEHACTPNSSFQANGRHCVCNDDGIWSDPTCDADSEIISEKLLETIGQNCVPHLTYFVDCNICTCPEVGVTIQAQCSPDPSCSSGITTSPEMILSRNMCMPKVMYLFPCLHCLCTELGTFSAENCYETCINQEAQCKPNSFYKRDCNVCYCPENGIKDNKICSNKDCSQQSNAALRKDGGQVKCSPHSFTEPKCLYCDCSSSGTVNENACLDLECIDTKGVEYNADKQTCRPGEMVLVCSECLCLETGTISSAYCSKTCTYESKLEVLNRAVKASIQDINVINKDKLRRTSGSSCRPEIVFIHNGRYCICPSNGIMHQTLCSLTNVDEYSFLKHMENNDDIPNRMKISFGAPCKIGIFVDFDCNSCFCSDGSIDAKWCTYDDCSIVTKSARPNKSQFHGFGHLIATPRPMVKLPDSETDGKCTPGAITKIDCNFCICPDSSQLQERACTKNNCTTQDQPINQDFSCEPMHYYEVDCNVCLCPKDGQKNVDKCTKNVCQRSYLRSMGCIPGQLFSDECNVCVCPLDGNKGDKACTDHNCPDSEANLMIFNNTQVPSLEERKLDFCFPGEQFIEDCKFCVCPDTGVKAHATCNSMLCDDEQRRLRHKGLGSRTHQVSYLGRSTFNEDHCDTFLEDELIERESCKPGLIYTSGCKQCICPSADTEEKFCRSIPSALCGNSSPQETTLHTHDSFPCSSPGKMMDQCFICECEAQGKQGVVIREHCFKSESVACRAAIPDFLINTSLK